MKLLTIRGNNKLLNTITTITNQLSFNNSNNCTKQQKSLFSSNTNNNPDNHNKHDKHDKSTGTVDSNLKKLENNYLNLDYFSLLNVSAKSDKSEIKKNYYQLAKLFHPDQYKGNTAIFKRITDAYKTLTNPSLRERYLTKLNVKHKYRKSDASYCKDSMFKEKYRKESNDRSEEHSNSEFFTSEQVSKYQKSWEAMDHDKLFLKFYKPTAEQMDLSYYEENTGSTVDTGNTGNTCNTSNSAKSDQNNNNNNNKPNNHSDIKNQNIPNNKDNNTNSNPHSNPPTPPTPQTPTNNLSLTKAQLHKLGEIKIFSSEVEKKMTRRELLISNSINNHEAQQLMRNNRQKAQQLIKDLFDEASLSLQSKEARKQVEDELNTPYAEQVGRYSKDAYNENRQVHSGSKERVLEDEERAVVSLKYALRRVFLFVVGFTVSSSVFVWFYRRREFVERERRVEEIKAVVRLSSLY